MRKIIGLFLAVVFFAGILFLKRKQKVVRFHEPTTITLEEVAKLRKEKEFCFSFHGKDGILCFGYKSETSRLMAVCGEKIPENLKHEKNNFIYTEHDGVGAWVLNEGFPKEEVSAGLGKSTVSHWNLYRFCSPRECKSANVKQISLDRLVKMLRDAKNRFILYSGAGLSMASGVWGMERLESELGLKDKVFDKEKALRAFDRFCELMLDSPPTKAHKSIAKLALENQWCALSENTDLLQERAGLMPYLMSDIKASKEYLPIDFLKEVKFVLCVGLSFDDRGFLAWYKKHNPKGLIIAIDTGHPSFLGEEDFLVGGDLQIVLPKVARALLNQMNPTS